MASMAAKTTTLEDLYTGGQWLWDIFPICHAQLRFGGSVRVRVQNTVRTGSDPNHGIPNPQATQNCMSPGKGQTLSHSSVGSGDQSFASGWSGWGGKPNSRTKAWWTVWVSTEPESQHQQLILGPHPLLTLEQSLSDMPFRINVGKRLKSVPIFTRWWISRFRTAAVYVRL